MKKELRIHAKLLCGKNDKILLLLKTLKNEQSKIKNKTMKQKKSKQNILLIIITKAIKDVKEHHKSEIKHSDLK